MTGNPNGRLSRRFLFTTTPFYGHLHPLIPLARTLKEAGHEVTFAASASLGPVVKAAGFTFSRPDWTGRRIPSFNS